MLTCECAYSTDCHKNKCLSKYLEACGSVTVPTDIVLDHL